MKLYVEGGGDSAALKSACRAGFTKFLTEAGLNNRPRVVACGSRRDAYESFCTAIAKGDDAMLLVDSENAIDLEKYNWRPWDYLKIRDGDNWVKPEASAETDCHLMVQVMESWFLADRDALKDFFGQGFEDSQLPPTKRPIEQISKPEIYKALKNATKNCKTKAPYGKGEHSFKLLARIKPEKVTAASPWARRFVEGIKKKMDG